MHLPDTVSLTDPLYVLPFASSKHSFPSGLVVLAAVEELVEADEEAGERELELDVGEQIGISQSSHAPSDCL